MPKAVTRNWESIINAFLFKVQSCPDLLIANYFSSSSAAPVPTPIAGNCEITFRGKPVLKAGGSSKTFSAVFRDAAGEVITGIEAVWDLELPPSITGKVTVKEQSGASIKLFADGGIGEKFILTLSASDATYGNFEAEIEITVGVLY